MKYKVLVTGTSSYGVGEGILKIVNESAYRSEIRLIGASNTNLTAYKNLAEKYYILPNANHPSYYRQIRNLIETEQIKILIPGSEAETIFFSRKKNEIESELNIDIWTNEYETIKIFDNKMNAEKFFQQVGINTPKPYRDCEGRFPLIIKPIQGKSSEGIFIVRNKQEYQAVCDFYNTIGKKIIVQEFVEKDAEYTVSLINLGNRLEVLCMERILNKGATQYAKIIEEKAIVDITEILHRALGEELILNLQVLKKDNAFYVFEVNPRFSGSAPMRAKLGYNEFDIIFAHKYLNKAHEYMLKKDYYCIRGYEEVIYNDKF